MRIIEFVFYSGVAVSLFILYLMWKTDRAHNKLIKEIEKEIEKRTNELNKKENGN